MRQLIGRGMKIGLAFSGEEIRQVQDAWSQLRVTKAIKETWEKIEGVSRPSLDQCAENQVDANHLGWRILNKAVCDKSDRLT